MTAFFIIVGIAVASSLFITVSMAADEPNVRGDEFMAVWGIGSVILTVIIGLLFWGATSCANSASSRVAQKPTKQAQSAPAAETPAETTETEPEEPAIPTPVFEFGSGIRLSHSGDFPSSCGHTKA